MGDAPAGPPARTRVSRGSTSAGGGGGCGRWVPPLVDFVHADLGTVCSSPNASKDGREPGSLLWRRRRLRPSGAPPPSGHASARGGYSGRAVAAGWLTERFSKPPGVLVFDLRVPVDVAAVVVDAATSAGGSAAVVTCSISQCAQSRRREDFSIVATAEGLDRAGEIYVLKMNSHASSLGLGGVEIWGTPSVECPAEVKMALREKWVQVRRLEEEWHERQAAERAAKTEIDARLVEGARINLAFGSTRTPTGVTVPPSPGDEPGVTGVPDDFVDPITHEIMKDPVTLPSGQCCDRFTVLRHFQASAKTTDPFTGLQMSADAVVSNDSLKERIDRWLAGASSSVQ